MGSKKSFVVYTAWKSFLTAWNETSRQASSIIGKESWVTMMTFKILRN